MVVFLGSAAVAGKESKSTGDYIIHPWDNIQSSLTSRASSEWDSLKDRLKDRLQHKLGISDHAMENVQKWGGMFYAIANAAFGAELWTKVEGTSLGVDVKNEIANLTASILPWLGTVWDARSVGQE